MEIWHLVVFFLAFRFLLANDIARRRRSREAMRERLYRRRMKLHEGRKRFLLMPTKHYDIPLIMLFVNQRYYFRAGFKPSPLVASNQTRSD